MESFAKNRESEKRDIESTSDIVGSQSLRDMFKSMWPFWYHIWYYILSAH